MVFSRFGHKYGIDFSSFGHKIAYGFYSLVLSWVCYSEEATFSSLSIRSSTKALLKLMFTRASVPAATVMRTSQFWSAAKKLAYFGPK